MAKVIFPATLMSLQPRGHFGFSGGYGLARYSIGRWGFFSEFAGIYQRHSTARGPGVSRMVFYRPTNPQTPAQQAWRSVFAAGMGVYSGLTDAEKKALSVEARKYRLSGLTLFLRRYLQSHR